MSWPAIATALAIVAVRAALLAQDPRGDPSVRFADITREAGIDFQHVNGASADKHLIETMGSGGLFFDFDNDGWIDIFLVDGGSLADPAVAKRARHRLYRNRGNATFEDVTTRSGITHRDYGMGACAGDYDNDGWVDLYVTNRGPNILYHNNRNGVFTDVTRTARVGSPLWSTSCAFADLDRDGDLDLFVTNYVTIDATHSPFCGNAKLRMRLYCHPLTFEPQPNIIYRNDGNGVFSDVTAEYGIAGNRGNSLGVVVADYDEDGWPDVFVANDSVPNFLFRNSGGRHFEDVALRSGTAVATDGKARAGMGIDAADYDEDGRLDLVVTNLDFETHSLFRGLGDGLFFDATSESGFGYATLPFVGFGVVFLDYDNDGHLDIAIANGHIMDNAPLYRAGATYAQRNLLFHNQTARRFKEVGRSAGPGFALEKVSRGLASADIDNDGDLDLLVTNNGQTGDLLRNDGGNREYSLLVRVIGVKSNRDGIGTRLRLTAAGRTQVREVKTGSSYLSQSDPRVHFGLGSVARVERLELRWPSGRTEIVQDVPANHLITVREGEGMVGATPFARARR
ncbi:MAG TPA: CRTAC1 family protein [Vicinamibacterales bacterium]|nr:CRTAC1 family protein [Vicinamibacterales bacterium]